MHKYTTKELVSAKPTTSKYKKIPKNPIVVVCDNIRSLENVGLIFRLCDALRVEKLYLCGITGYPKIENDPRRFALQERANRMIKRTAIKTIDLVPWEHIDKTIDIVKELKQKGYEVISIEQTKQSIDYTKTDAHFPIALVVGHERDGITDDVLKESDVVVQIPMYGIGNNLNVATALAVVGFEMIHHGEGITPIDIHWKKS
jgi:23S rRNA (guanosine2251-2'-O)-methyltransferase